MQQTLLDRAQRTQTTPTPAVVLMETLTRADSATSVRVLRHLAIQAACGTFDAVVACLDDGSASRFGLWVQQLAVDTLRLVLDGSELAHGDQQAILGRFVRVVLAHPVATQSAFLAQIVRECSGGGDAHRQELLWHRALSVAVEAEDAPSWCAALSPWRRSVLIGNVLSLIATFQSSASNRGVVGAALAVVHALLRPSTVRWAFRDDLAGKNKSVDIMTGRDDPLPRCKPFKYTYEKEIVMYAHFKKLDYFSTECIYSPNAYRGYVRELIKDLEKVRPSIITDIIHSGESLKIDTSNVTFPKKMSCKQCGFVASNDLCKACVLLEGLNKGKARVAIGRKE